MSVAEEAMRKATGGVNTPVGNYGGAPIPPGIIRTGYTSTETVPTRWNQTLLSGKISQFKSTDNALL